MQENYSYYLPQEYEEFFSKFPPNFTAFQSNISSFIDFEANVIPYDHHQPLISNNSCTSDEVDEGYMSIINERKHRRMISNRESSRRSRVRKQRQLDELCTQVKWLRNENHGLMVKLNRFSESQEQVIQENDKLKKESLELKKLLSEAQLDNTYTTLGDLGFFRDLHDDEDYGYDDHDHDHEVVLTSCPTAHLRAQSSHKF